MRGSKSNACSAALPESSADCAAGQRRRNAVVEISPGLKRKHEWSHGLLGRDCFKRGGGVKGLGVLWWLDSLYERGGLAFTTLVELYRTAFRDYSWPDAFRYKADGAWQDVSSADAQV
jgi:hypothetical protein